MSNPFFDALGPNSEHHPSAEPTPEQIRQTQSSIQAVKANPSDYIRKNFGMNVPRGANNPMQVLQHLANSGQLNQAQMRAFQQLQKMPWVGRR